MQIAQYELGMVAVLVMLSLACSAPAAAPATQPAPAVVPAPAAAPAPAASKPAEAKPAAPATQPAPPAAPAPVASKPAAELKKVKIASLFVVNFTPVHLAKELGYFRDEGLDAEMIQMQSGNEISQAVLSRSADVGTTAMERPMLLYEKGVLSKNMVGLMMRSSLSILVQPDFAGKMGDLAALKGLKIGITGPGSKSDVTLRGMLREKGLDPDKDVTILAVGSGPSSVAGLKAKQIDALVALEPNTTVALDQKIGKMFLDVRDPNQAGSWAKVADSTVQATDEWLKQNPELAKAVIRAVVKAHQTIKNDRPTTLRVMKAIFASTDPQLTEKVCETECPGLSAPVSEELHKIVNKAYKDAGQLKADIPYEAVTTVEYKDLWR